MTPGGEGDGVIGDRHQCLTQGWVRVRLHGDGDILEIRRFEGCPRRPQGGIPSMLEFLNALGLRC